MSKKRKLFALILVDWKTLKLKKKCCLNQLANVFFLLFLFKNNILTN